MPHFERSDPRPAAPRPPPAAIPIVACRDRRHHIALQNGERCPRCGSDDVGTWGRFSGRRRFRCRACRRTFSTFTATPLQHLKRLDGWPAFQRAVDDRASVRRAAKRIGVSPSTAFRWRHRLLADWRRRDRVDLKGCVELDFVWLAESEKGKRPRDRPPRRRGYRTPGWIPDGERVTVVLFREERDSVPPVSAGGFSATAAVAEAAAGPGGARARATAAFIAPRGPGASWWIVRRVLPTLREVVQLETILPLSNLPAWMGSRDVRRRPGLAGEPVRDPRTSMSRQLVRWLRPLRGVATRYLENYLQWFRTDLHDPPRNSSREHTRGVFADWVEGVPGAGSRRRPADRLDRAGGGWLRR